MLLLLLVFFGFQSTTVAQSQPAAAARLSSITVSGSKRFTSDQIAAAAGLHAGQTITRDDLQRAADHLSQLGTFATVNYRFADAQSGVKVDYQVTDAATVSVTFDNFPQLSDDEIIQALKKNVVLFDGTAPEHGTILDDMARTIQALLEDRAVQTTVSHELTGPGQSEGTQRVQVFRAEGMVPTIQTVTFSDALANENRGLQSSLGDLIGKPYSRSVLQLFAFEQVRPIYLAHGYLKAQFDAPVSKLNLNQANAAASTVDVTIPLVAGPAFTWNGVTWIGANAVPPAQLDAVVQLKSGDPADGLRIEGAWQRASDAFARLGYLDVNLDSVPQFDDGAKKVAYIVTIKQGPQYRMGKLVLTGLSVEGERRIREAWKIHEGAFFDNSEYEEFLDSGVKTAFFVLPFHYDKIGRFLQKDPGTGIVDVLLDFQ